MCSDLPCGSVSLASSKNVVLLHPETTTIVVVIGRCYGCRLPMECHPFEVQAHVGIRNTLAVAAYSKSGPGLTLTVLHLSLLLELTSHDVKFLILADLGFLVYSHDVYSQDPTD